MLSICSLCVVYTEKFKQIEMNETPKNIDS